MFLSAFQIYFYASYVFKEAGISTDQTQYVTIGTGTCEFTACIMCVSRLYNVGAEEGRVESYTIWNSHHYCACSEQRGGTTRRHAENRCAF